MADTEAVIDPVKASVRRCRALVRKWHADPVSPDLKFGQITETSFGELRPGSILWAHGAGSFWVVTWREDDPHGDTEFVLHCVTGLALYQGFGNEVIDLFHHVFDLSDEQDRAEWRTYQDRLT